MASFVHVLDDEDLMDELRERTQDEKELVAQYITNCQ